MTADLRGYPTRPADAGLELFLRWLGAHYARTVSIREATLTDGVLSGVAVVGRRWTLSVALLDTLAHRATPDLESHRGTIEQRLDDDGQSLVVWAPPGAALPAEEPALSALLTEIERAREQPDGRLEIPRPVTIRLWRSGTTGSVVTVVGGLAGSWAQFTNKVPGTFQLDSRALHRLPAGEEARLGLANVIVQAAAQPTVDEGLELRVEDCWTANRLESGRSCVLATPGPDTDETAAALRRELRRLLRSAGELASPPADARALVVLGMSTYADDEKLTWALRGMDPRLYAGFDIIAVVTDGLVKPVMQPSRGALPWDAPLS